MKPARGPHTIFCGNHFSGIIAVQIQVKAICNRCPFWSHLVRLAQGLPNMKGQAKCAKAIFCWFCLQV